MKPETEAEHKRLDDLFLIERAIMRALWRNNVGDYHYWSAKRKELMNAKAN